MNRLAYIGIVIAAIILQVAVPGATLPTILARDNPLLGHIHLPRFRFVPLYHSSTRFGKTAITLPEAFMVPVPFNEREFTFRFRPGATIADAWTSSNHPSGLWPFFKDMSAQ